MLHASKNCWCGSPRIIHFMKRFSGTHIGLSLIVAAAATATAAATAADDTTKGTSATKLWREENVETSKGLSARQAGMEAWRKDLPAQLCPDSECKVKWRFRLVLV